MRTSRLLSLCKRMRSAFVEKAPAALSGAPAGADSSQRETHQEAPGVVREREENKRLDQALKETFPASDPISPYIPSAPRKDS